MDLITSIIVSVIAGIFSIMAFYYTFSKNIEEFYETTILNDIPVIGLVVGLLGTGLHKLYKKIFPRQHHLALKITTFMYGILFLLVATGSWIL